MKKLIEKDKQTRKKIIISEKKRFVLKTIYSNFYFMSLIRYNAITHLNKISSKSSKTFISNRCVFTVNKKKFNKLTNFSRIIFRKLVKTKKIFGIYKSAR